MTYALLSMLTFTGKLTLSGWKILPIGTFQYVPACTLVPRFILNLRALYARDLQGRCGGDIDTAFGLTLSSTHGAGASAIMFAGAGQNERLDPVEDIQMEEIHSAKSSAC